MLIPCHGKLRASIFRCELPHLLQHDQNPFARLCSPVLPALHFPLSLVGFLFKFMFDYFHGFTLLLFLSSGLGSNTCRHYVPITQVASIQSASDSEERNLEQLKAGLFTFTRSSHSGGECNFPGLLRLGEVRHLQVQLSNRALRPQASTAIWCIANCSISHSKTSRWI